MPMQSIYSELNCGQPAAPLLERVVETAKRFKQTGQKSPDVKTCRTKDLRFVIWQSEVSVAHVHRQAGRWYMAHRCCGRWNRVLFRTGHSAVPTASLTVWNTS
eukprot:jgi/Ulvmu1/10219/UM060_0019.1